MKRVLACLALLAFSAPSYAAVTCEDIKNGEDYKVLREGNILTKKNWKTIDVVAEFDYQECKDAVSQTLIKIKGEFFWKFASHEDSCDGGNTYGVIYTYDLKTPMVHIYDSDMYCKSEGWNEDSLASNHKCDLAAEEYAQKKMKKFGLNFKVSSSSLQLRKPYIYSFIFVTGTITNKGNQKATVKVNTRVPTCEFGGASIDHLEL